PSALRPARGAPTDWSLSPHLWGDRRPLGRRGGRRRSRLVYPACRGGPRRSFRLQGDDGSSAGKHPQRPKKTDGEWCQVPLTQLGLSYPGDLGGLDPVRTWGPTDHPCLVDNGHVGGNVAV